MDPEERIAQLEKKLADKEATLKRVAGEREEWKAKANGFSEQIGTLQSENATVGVLTEQVQQWQARAETAEASRSEDLALFRAGIDDDAGMLTARTLHSGLGEDAPPLQDWLSSLVADPTQAPKPLAAYFAAETSQQQTQQQTTQTETQQTQQSRSGLPKANNGTRTTTMAATSQAYTAERIRELSKDPAAFKEHLPAIMRDIAENPQ